MITLDKVTEIERVVVKWRDSEGNGVDYGSEYKVLYTSVTEPPDPNLDDGYWKTAASITTGTGGVETFDLKQPHLALSDHHGLLSTISPLE